MAVNISTKIKEWSINKDEIVDVMAISEGTKYEPAYFNAKPISIIDNIDKADDGGLCFVKLTGCNSWIYAQSVLLTPIDDWSEITRIQSEYIKFRNKSGGLVPDEYRVLTHLKYRGKPKENQILLSDRSNKSQNLTPLIPTINIIENIGVNENMIFEIELEDYGIRNFFYNSSKRKFVNLKQPSWMFDREKRLR